MFLKNKSKQRGYASADSKKYTSLLKLSVIDLMTEIPGFVLVLACALSSSALIMWLDAIDSFKNILNIIILIVLSFYLRRNLKYRYNYGTGKLESIGSIITDVLMMIGLCITLYFSVDFFINPAQPSENLLYAIFVKFGNVVINVYFLWKQIKINKMGSNSLTKSGVYRFIGNLAFDASAFLGVLFSFLFRNSKFSWYINPVLCFVFSIGFLVVCARHIRSCVEELLDKTLPEKEQMKLMKILTKHINEYKGFVSLDSRRNGTKVFIDVALSFDENATYSEMKTLSEKIAAEIKEVESECEVRFVITEKSENAEEERESETAKA